MIYFDQKQKRLIMNWHEMAEKSENAYMKFISNWIAFNAICYNLYKEDAVKTGSKLIEKNQNWKL